MGSPSPTEPLVTEPPSASASVRGRLSLARLALPLLLPVAVLLLWVGPNTLTKPVFQTTTATAAARTAAGSEAAPPPSQPQPGNQLQTKEPPAQAEEWARAAAAAAMGKRRRRRLLARVAGMERVLAADDARRARRARRAAKGGAKGKEGEGDLGSYYNAAAAVPAGVIYPEGAPAAGGGRGNRTMDSLVPPESDALFRATVEALLLDKDKSEDGPPQNNNRTYHVVLRGGSISAGGDMVAVGGREPLHQEQAIALLNAAFAGTPVQWRLIDMAKGNTESSDSLGSFNLFDPSAPLHSVRLLLWEYLVNDERNLKKPAAFERWIRTHLHWYPNADMGFIMVPGVNGPGIDRNTTGMELAPVSNTETEYREIIQHYATPAGQPGHKCHRPRSLFVNSLGPLIQQSGRRFDAFYGKPPSDPHPNLLGYQAMGDMLAYHIKGRIRAALAHVRTVLADDTAAPATAAAARAGTPEPTLAILRRAAGVDEAAVQTGAMQDAQTKGQEKNGSLSLSLWLSLPPEPWSLPDKAAAATPAAAAGAAGAGVSAEKRMDAVPWLYRPPNDLEWKVMTNPMYMATTVKFHRPSPNGRDLEGVTLECRRADGETTWEPGMVYALEALGNEEEGGGCTNLRGIGQPGVHYPGRVDWEIKIIPPRCDATDRTYTIQVPFGFSRFSGPVLWPVGELGLYLGGRPVARDKNSQPIVPAWTFDPPVAPGARLRLCWNATKVDGEAQVVLHHALSFT